MRDCGILKQHEKKICSSHIAWSLDPMVLSLLLLFMERRRGDMA
jgi:hypothetical protein